DGKYSFPEMIEFASREEFLRAGDLIGSGTVGTGCGLELDKWIKEGDAIELKVEKIGILKNTVGKKVKIYG
ncbi:MAG: fumarylacetoacetate hydrolase family protein, partial [Bacteriovoracaceae bacterium]